MAAAAAARLFLGDGWCVSADVQPNTEKCEAKAQEAGWTGTGTKRERGRDRNRGMKKKKKEKE